MQLSKAVSRQSYFFTFFTTKDALVLITISNTWMLNVRKIIIISEEVGWKLFGKLICVEVSGPFKMRSRNFNKLEYWDMKEVD